eukprot:1783578-Rhodomonas_salina.1
MVPDSFYASVLARLRCTDHFLHTLARACHCTHFGGQCSSARDAPRCDSALLYAHHTPHSLPSFAPNPQAASWAPRVCRPIRAFCALC